MKNLINFFLKYDYWFLFIFLEVISFVLLFSFNNYQQSLFFTSANKVVGNVYEVSGEVTSYFHLKKVNDFLLDKNISLEAENSHLKEFVKRYKADSAFVESYLGYPDYRLIKAHVINNSLNRVDNYITLNKGTRAGIRSEMGVVNGQGVVGIVYKTSDSYSVVISLLNSKSNISCKILGSDYFGYLRWETTDCKYASLKDLPRHAEFNIGDTVVTSGYSTIFPEGVMVGTINELSFSNDGLSYNLKVKLSTDFGNLGDVRVIQFAGKEEKFALEKSVLEE